MSAVWALLTWGQDRVYSAAILRGAQEHSACPPAPETAASQEPHVDHVGGMTVWEPSHNRAPRARSCQK